MNKLILMNAIWRIWVVVLLPLLMRPAIATAQFTFTTNNNAITITGYTGPVGALIIPTSTNGYPVVSIGNNAFRSYFGLTNVVIPNSVTSVGNFAFAFCSQLTGITIPGSVTNIADSAFEYCSSLTSIAILDSATRIGNWAFENCYSLTNVIMGSGVTSIGDSVFLQCSSLPSITIPSSVTNIGIEAFAYCSSLTAITVDTNNPSFSSVAGVLFDKRQNKLFEYPGGLVGSYTILDSVTSIGKRRSLAATT